MHTGAVINFKGLVA